MVRMNVKIDKDENLMKFISIIKRNTNHGVTIIKNKIDKKAYVMDCDYFETDELKKMKNVIDELAKANASLHLFQDDREVGLGYIDNLIENYDEISKDREDLDDLVLGENE